MEAFTKVYQYGIEGCLAPYYHPLMTRKLTVLSRHYRSYYCTKYCNNNLLGQQASLYENVSSSLCFNLGLTIKNNNNKLKRCFF